MIRRDFLTGRWIPYLDHAISLKPCYQGGSNGGEVYLISFMSFILHCNRILAVHMDL